MNNVFIIEAKLRLVLHPSYTSGCALLDLVPLNLKGNSQEVINMAFVRELLSHLNSKIEVENSVEMIKLTFVFTLTYYIFGSRPIFKNVNIVNIHGF